MMIIRSIEQHRALRYCYKRPFQNNNFPLIDRHNTAKLTSSSAIAERKRESNAGCVSFVQKWNTLTGRQYFTDITGLSSTTVTKSAYKAIEFGEKMQNKSYYAVQGHSRS